MTVAGGVPDRPAVATPGRVERAAPQQPALGAAGLLLVIPVVWLLAFAFGPRTSVRDLAPLATFAVPVIVMVAFWWENWPGTRLRRSWSGWADTAFIGGLSVALTALGEAVTDGEPMPLAGLVFVVMLQLTFACEGWPLRGRLPGLTAGPAALAVSWVVALALWAALPDLGAFPVLLGAWQVWFYVAWGGWPFSGIDRRAVRLPVANAAVLAATGLTFVATQGAAETRVTAVAGAFVAAALLVGMLFEGWLGRWASLAAVLVLGAGLELALQAYGAGDEWVAHAAMNAIGIGVILHVAIGRRWPLA